MLESEIAIEWSTAILAPQLRLLQNSPPGGQLSLQKHHHCAERWIVVTGTKEVTRANEVLHVHENSSIYLPIGCLHRPANPGKMPPELIKVQTGSYLGEDDIVRMEDIYNRN